jgi:hypothetical protein
MSCMIHHRPKFLAEKEERARRRAAEASAVGKSNCAEPASSFAHVSSISAVPEILVDGGPSTPLPPSSSRDITLAGRLSVYIADTPDRLTLSADAAGAHGRRRSDMSTLSADLGSLSPHRYAQSNAHEDVCQYIPLFIVVVIPRLLASPPCSALRIKTPCCNLSIRQCGEVSS